MDFIVENYELNRASGLMTHRARGCPFIANVDGEDFVIDGYAKYKGYCDECRVIYFWFAALLLLFFVEPKQIFFRINNLTIQTR